MDPSRIASLLAPFVAEVSDAQLSMIGAYLDLLLRWNARMNLTSVRDPEQVITRHFGESFFAATYLYSEPGTRDWGLIDIGSGAGFPGLPIKIYAPDLHLTLLESNQRKATFLREVVRTLHLSAVEVVADRAESFAGKIANHKTPDSLTVTLRAVEQFGNVLLTAIQLLKNGGAAERRLALLIGTAQVTAAREAEDSIAWSEPLAIPQSERRVLLVGALR